MSRPLRIEYPGAFYHITSRGNEKRSIYQTEKDYQRFIGYLESATERYGAKIHCFCLMPNHYHLLLETPRGNLHSILHHLNTSYTNYFNLKTGRVGHLFQGRYKGILVDKDNYALELSRYIHLNPVRAHLVKDPSQYPWSSYLAYSGKEKGWDWLQTDFILDQLSSKKREACRQYQAYVREVIEKDLENPLKKVMASTLLGSEKFVEEVKRRWLEGIKPLRDIPALRKIISGPDLFSVLKESEGMFGEGTVLSRRVALYLAHRLSGLPLEEIGKFFGGIGPSAVSQNTHRFEESLKQDLKLFEKVEKIKKKLSE
ncbi:MAG: transposase [Thermodesulfobacteriota bacterium]